MANAKKCDICGSLYDSPVCNDSVRIKLELQYAGDLYIDLCDNCYNKLCKFVAPIVPNGYSVERYRAERTGGNDA